MKRHQFRALAAALAGAMLLAGPQTAAAQTKELISGERTGTETVEVARGAVTNLPLPRFVSLKGSEGNARRGPGLSHRIDWVFRHPGMPLMITAEHEHWRRVEDADGAGGWVHYALLSGVRTAIVRDDGTGLHAGPGSDQIVARAEVGAIVRLSECAGDWCRVGADRLRGWVRRAALWGVFADETVK